MKSYFSEELKYIVVTDRGCECAIIFNVIVTHRTVASGFFTPVSAGFCKLYPTKEGGIEVSAYGRSETLNISSRPEDAKLIEITLQSSIDIPND